LFIFLIQLKNLENAAADFLAKLQLFSAGGRLRLIGPEGSQALIEPLQELAFALEQRGRRHGLLLLEVAIFIMRELVKFSADLEVREESGLIGHGCKGAVGAGLSLAR